MNHTGQHPLTDRKKRWVQNPHPPVTGHDSNNDSENLTMSTIHRQLPQYAFAGTQSPAASDATTLPQHQPQAQAQVQQQAQQQIQQQSPAGDAEPTAVPGYN